MQCAGANGNHPSLHNQKEWSHKTHSFCPGCCEDLWGGEPWSSSVPAVISHSDFSEQHLIVRVTKLPSACKLWQQILTSLMPVQHCLHTETLQIPILLIFVISRDKPACGTGTHLHLAPPCICCLQMGQSQTSAGTARGFWPCLMQNRLPINFPWINLTAELGVLSYFRRLSLAHLLSGRAGTSGWHQTVIFFSSSSDGLYLLLLGYPLTPAHPGRYCKSVWGLGRCLHSERWGVGPQIPGRYGQGLENR